MCWFAPSLCLPVPSPAAEQGSGRSQSPPGAAPICQSSCCVVYLKPWQKADFGLGNSEISFMQTAALEQHSEFYWCYVKEDTDHMPDIWGKKAKYVGQHVMSCTQGRSETSAFQNAFCSLESDSHSILTGLCTTLSRCLYFTLKTFPPELLWHPFESFCRCMWWTSWRGDDLVWIWISVSVGKLQKLMMAGNS